MHFKINLSLHIFPTALSPFLAAFTVLSQRAVWVCVLWRLVLILPALSKDISKRSLGFRLQMQSNAWGNNSSRHRSSRKQQQQQQQHGRINQSNLHRWHPRDMAKSQWMVIGVDMAFPFDPPPTLASAGEWQQQQQRQHQRVCPLFVLFLLIATFGNGSNAKYWTLPPKREWAVGIGIGMEMALRLDSTHTH